MAAIGIKHILRPNPAYPIERILVDTSIIIRYENPFGFVKPHINSRTITHIHKLKNHYSLHATMISAAEYFKYIQVGYYNIFIQTRPGHFQKYSIANFKKLRKANADFASGWKLRLKAFRKTFTRHFPPLPEGSASIYSPELFTQFDGNALDFGDMLFFREAEKHKNMAILTADKDFADLNDTVLVIRV